MDWLDLLVVQGALKSLLQHHSSKASILQQNLKWLNFQHILFIKMLLEIQHFNAFFFFFKPKSGNIGPGMEYSHIQTIYNSWLSLEIKPYVTIFL